MLLLTKHNQTPRALPPPQHIFVLLLTKHNQTLRALPPPQHIFVLLLTKHYARFLPLPIYVHSNPPVQLFFKNLKSILRTAAMPLTIAFDPYDPTVP